MSEGGRIIEERIGEVKRLVYCAVKDFFGTDGYEPDDILQDGMLGVMVHRDEFDPEKGALSTFVAMTARTWVTSRRLKRDRCDKRKANFGALSLDAPLKRERSNENGTPLVDLIPDEFDLEEDVERRVDAERAYQLIDQMDYRTAAILRGRYGDDQKTLRELGNELGLSNERVRQLEEAGLRRLRVHMRA